MLERLKHNAVDFVELLGVEGKLVVRLLSRSATMVALMLVAALVGGVALMGLAGAAVVALAVQMGTAGALAVVCGGLLLLCTISVLALWTATENLHKQFKIESMERKLELQKQQAIERLKAAPPPQPAPVIPGAGLLDLGKVDPVLVVAAVGAAAALVGPKRLMRFGTGLLGKATLINSVITAGRTAMSGMKTANGRF